MKNLEILIRNGFIDIPNADESRVLNPAELATLMGNIAYYGFALSEEALTALNCCSYDLATSWWKQVEPVLSALTGADKRMGDHVVYKNFPAEVLAMNDAQYWGRQILMYLGYPNKLFTEEVEPREAKTEKPKFRILHLSEDETLIDIFGSLCRLPSRWTEDQVAQVRTLAPQFKELADLSGVSFKENMVLLATMLIESGVEFSSSSATDVVRLAVALSGGDVSMKEPSKFAKFKRNMRQTLLSLLERSSNLQEDISRDPEKFKRLFVVLHPGDYARRFPKTVEAYNKLYNRDLPKGFNSVIEAKLAAKDASVLKDLKGRPGEFMRRLRVALSAFNMDAANAFAEVMPKLKVIQLLKIEKYLETFNGRKDRMFAPRGNWSKVQLESKLAAKAEQGKIQQGRFNSIKGLKTKYKANIPNVPNPRGVISTEAVHFLLENIRANIRKKIEPVVGEINLDPNTARIKIQTNDSELSPFGRGTRFPIPESIKFIRSASYWGKKLNKGSYGNFWYDNGWNFFDQNWRPKSTCCWSNPSLSFVQDKKGNSTQELSGWNWHSNSANQKKGDIVAVFSGDPTNSRTADGKACQMIDLYLDNMAKHGIRYAVWNILCYSKQAFDENDVYAALQWGVEPKAGELFDPARVQLAFPVKGPNFTKYIVYIDLQTREMVYLDANLPANVSSASSNEAALQETMPAFLETIDALPSVHDLFKNQKIDAQGLPVLYTDKDVKIEGTHAYVFNPDNKDNTFEKFDINQLLNL